MDLLLRIKQTIKDRKWELTGSQVVAAVSGGPDSVAMLDAFAGLRDVFSCNVIVAHVNHKLRANEADEDERFVRSLAERYGMECHVLELNWVRRGIDDSDNLHDFARRQRYQFFDELALACGAKFVATAHHADDQAESVLLHLFRGTGLEGLRGLALERELTGSTLIRPLFSVSKEELLAYCEARKLVYRTDTSNLQPYYSRNRLRLEVLTRVQSLFPGYREALMRVAEIAGDDHDFLATETESVFTEMVQTTPGGFYFRRPSFLSLHVALQRRLIKLLFNYLMTVHDVDGSAALSFAEVERVREMIRNDRRPTAQVCLVNFFECVRSYEEIRVGRSNSTLNTRFNSSEVAARLDESEDFSCDRLSIHQQTISRQQYEAERDEFLRYNRNVAWFDADSVSFPLTVRFRVPGDRIELLGNRGSSKVKNVMIDAKLPAHVRQLIPLVFDAEGRLLWIAGVRRSKHATVEADTQRVLKLKWLHNYF